MFEVDKDKCIRCGVCVQDCAFKALGSDREGRPYMRKPERCMKCQHCFAVCPVGAVAFDGKRAEDSLATKGLVLPSAEAERNWLLSRAIGIRPQTPFYAMLFGKAAIDYLRTVQRNDYATIEYH